MWNEDKFMRESESGVVLEVEQKAVEQTFSKWTGKWSGTNVRTGHECVCVKKQGGASFQN